MEKEHEVMLDRTEA